jgi:hypothetical protein
MTPPLELAEGAQLLLTRGDDPGRPAVRDYNGHIISTESSKAWTPTNQSGAP